MIYCHGWTSKSAANLKVTRFDIQESHGVSKNTFPSCHVYSMSGMVSMDDSEPESLVLEVTIFVTKV